MNYISNQDICDELVIRFGKGLYNCSPKDIDHLEKLLVKGIFKNKVPYIKFIKEANGISYFKDKGSNHYIISPDNIIYYCSKDYEPEDEYFYTGVISIELPVNIDHCKLITKTEFLYGKYRTGSKSGT